MSEHLKLFQRITTSIELLAANESGSQEIQQSATGLRRTLQPCLEELQRSAEKLQELLQPCFDELARAEAVWDSKPKIVQASTTEIREHLGHLTGSLFKLQILKSQLISEVLTQARSSWQTQVQSIKEKWFLDQKSANFKSINPPDKERFIQSLNQEAYQTSMALRLALIHAFQRIQAQLQQTQINRVTNYLDLLDSQQKSSWDQLLQNLNLSTLKLEEPFDNLPTGIQNFFDAIRPLVQRLIDQSFLTGNLPGKSAIKSLLGHGILPLTWENFSNFVREVDEVLEQMVNTIIEDRVDFVLNLLKQHIQFYDDFLEKQERYEQENLDQRKLEQNWLTARRQDLEKLRNDAAMVLGSLCEANKAG